MTVPESTVGDGMQAQVLIELGKQSKDLAVISTKLDSVLTAQTDHEQRIRGLEDQARTIQGGRDAHARVVSYGAVFAAIGSAVASYLHH